DVAHDRDDGRTPGAILDLVLLDRGDVFGLVRVLAHGLEAELAGDELDLVEVESLVDGDHQPHLLEGERDDLRGWRLQDLRELADRDELIDADGLAFALGLGGAGGLDILTPDATEIAGAAARGGAAHGRHRFRNVRIHGFLIDGAALPFLSPAALGL